MSSASFPLRGPGSDWRREGAVALISCYELGRQPFNIASPWAQLEAEGFGVAGVDTSITPLSDAPLEHAQLVAFSVPMHTALRLAVALMPEVRRRAPRAHVCFYGLYAALNAAYLLDGIADSVIGGEFEQALVALARGLERGDDGTVEGVTRAKDEMSAGPTGGGKRVAPAVLRKLPFVVPRRDRLEPPRRYATFFGPTAGEKRQMGYVEATRGCKHRCLHCPVTPVYDGRFFVVPADVVLADAAQQIALGASHITFGDPDFFNGPGHGMRVARALHAAHPEVSFDVTIKIEHILQHHELIAELAAIGCAFVISAVESLSDHVLAQLRKGHTRADVEAALAICRRGGLALRPSLVSFTPWTTLDDYIAVVDWLVREGLVDHIEPIQLAIRLLVPPGSALLREPGDKSWLGALDPAAFSHAWRHPDPRMDVLFEDVSSLCDVQADGDPGEVVLAIRELAHAAAGRSAPPLALPPRRFVPHSSEAWFCCAEPNTRQLAAVTSGCRPA